MASASPFQPPSEAAQACVSHTLDDSSAPRSHRMSSRMSFTGHSPTAHASLPSSPTHRRLSHRPALDHDHGPEGSRSRHCLGSDEADRQAEVKDANIAIRLSSKQAEQNVSPFLVEHIPQQYDPLGAFAQPSPMDGSNTKFCYRHRPDLKCRRQADEPSMEQLQNELGTLSQSDQQGISHVWSLFSAAPSKHRNLILQGILAQCCFPQLSLISASVRDLIKIDFLSALPQEIGLKILCFLDTNSLCKAAQVSHRWKMMADDDVVWHKMCEQHIDRKCTKCGWGLPLLERKRLRSEKRRMQLRAAGNNRQWSPKIAALSDVTPPRASSASLSGTDTSVQTLKRRSSHSPERSIKRRRSNSLDEDPGPHDSPSRPRPWKEVYKDRFKVGSNWKYGRCTTKIIRGHSNGVMCLQFDDNIVATGSYDSTIKIWDIETGELRRTLVGHTGGIRCLQFDDFRLISGGVDRTLKMWNWRTGQCLRTLTGPAGGIIGLHSDANLLACGSMDTRVQVWNTTDRSTFRLCGHKDWINAVKVDAASRTLFSASDDCTVRLWDLDSRRCIRVFEDHVGQVQQVLLLPPEFEVDEDPEPDGHVSGATSTGSEKPDQNPFDLSCDPNAMVTPPSTANASDRSAPQPLTPQTPLGPAPVSTLFPDDPSRPLPPRYMLTGALDSTIRLWNVQTGRCVRTFFGHVEGVWAIAADTLRVISGSEDRMVKVWDPRTGKCERTFTGHLGPVTCVALSDSRMVTGSEDCEVRIYSFRETEEANMS